MGTPIGQSLDACAIVPSILITQTSNIHIQIQFLAKKKQILSTGVTGFHGKKTSPMHLGHKQERVENNIVENANLIHHMPLGVVRSEPSYNVCICHQTPLHWGRIDFGKFGYAITAAGHRRKC